jgi:hypothetical protein
VERMKKVKKDVLEKRSKATKKKAQYEIANADP